MKNLLTLYNTFAGQQSPDDCGIACLAMILNYEGRYKDSENLFFSVPVQAGGLSMLELRNISLLCGLSSRCVSMDLPALHTLTDPCILHVRNEAREDHFVVCFGREKRKDGFYYLIGDPATRIHFIKENVLAEIWASHAALYFENLRHSKRQFRDHPWFGLLRVNALRNTLFISVPLLNVCVTVLGVALSWILQRGINDSLVDKKESLQIAIILLLFMIMIFRSLGNYLRQRILINLNREVREKFTNCYLTALFQQGNRSRFDKRSVKKGLNDIQRIQNAVTALVSVLISDGCILTVLISGLCYFEPFVGIINIGYAAIAIYTGMRASSELGYRQAEISEIAASAEGSLLDGLSCPSPDHVSLNLQLTSQAKVLDRSGLLAVSIGRYNLYYDCIGAVNVIAVFVLCICHIRQQQISYNMLMTEVILTYFVTTLLPKICSVFPVITDGAMLIKRFHKTN